jgi:para-aminobenzoate synthetase component 1
MRKIFKKKLKLNFPFDRLIKADNLQPPFLWLDTRYSGNHEKSWSLFAEKPRYQIVVKDGVALLDGHLERGNFWSLIDKFHALRSFLAELEDEVLPFPGMVLALSYELKDDLEPRSQGRQKSVSDPDLVAFFYDMWLILDHKSGICHFLGVDHDGDIDFEKRFEDFYQRLQKSRIQTQRKFSFQAQRIVPDREKYLESVENLKKSMFQGKFYQANMTRKYELAMRGDPRDFYLKLREISPSPFALFMEMGNQTLLSASPERFIRIKGQEVETRPIKGTRPRLSDLEKDRKIQKELRESEKDIAELTMIVDLMRNDLARFCLPGSVTVKELFRLESHAGVHHLVGSVQGKTERPWSLEKLIRAVFPGGSITGAPKIAAMKALTVHEPEARGFYTGSVFLLSAQGNLDSNILIRSLICEHGRIRFHVGGGITVGSEAFAELQETRDKARSLLEALGVKDSDFEQVETT